MSAAPGRPHASSHRSAEHGGTPVSTTTAVAVPPAPAVRRRRGLAPLEPVSASAKWLLGLAFFILFFAVWALATLMFAPPAFTTVTR